MRCVVVAFLASIVLLSQHSPASAQAPAAPITPPGASPARRVIPIADRVFDVVSIKLNPTESGQGMIGGTSNRLVITGMPLRNLIAWAYRTDPFRVVDGPAWINHQHYDVVGTPKAGAGWDDEMPDMLQKALQERFAMKVAQQQRSLPVYTLRRARADGRLGPGLRRSTVDCTRKGVDRSGCWLKNGASSVEAIGRDWKQIDLVRTLRRSLGEMVVDQTGLSGQFDLKAEWTAGVTLSGQVGDQVSVFTALKEQLGLQLVRATMPIDVVAVQAIAPLIED